jgi:energy-converting hydrogenase Eha subunit H
MLEIPAIVFYAATVAMIVVATFIAVLLFYLIRAARVVLSIAEFVEDETRRVRGGLREIRRAFALASALFFK